MTASPNPSGAELVVDHLSRTYGGEVRALDDVSFRVEPGELALVTGRSGAGKSTLLNLIGALDRPDAGTITVDGIPLSELEDPARYRREVVGFVFQLHHLIAAMSAEENVELPLLATDAGLAERRERGRAALAAVGMERRAGHRPSQLSGGERQRVAIARALVNRPKLLLADEPTASLDQESAEELLNLLGTLRSDPGCTILIVSHDPEAPRYASRVLEFRDGRLERDRGPAVPLR